MKRNYTGVLEYTDGSSPTWQAMACRNADVPVLNRILLDIPEEEAATLRPFLEFRRLPARTVLHEPGQAIEAAYFLESGLASLVVPTSEGESVEAGVVGAGGFVGIPLLFGTSASLVQTIVQISGSGWSIAAEHLVRLLPDLPRLRAKMNRYSLMQGMLMAQNSACNRLHELQQRLARWLLNATDLVGPEFEITQENLAQMLGTGRASLSVTSSRIRKAGILSIRRGWWRILNRGGLELLSCECYGVERGLRQQVEAEQGEPFGSKWNNSPKDNVARSVR